MVSLGTYKFWKLDEKKYLLKYHLPLAEVITDLFDKLKSLTRGYGSMEFNLIGYKEADIKKLVILLMGDPGIYF
jgi:GTP-binding protein LepA